MNATSLLATFGKLFCFLPALDLVRSEAFNLRFIDRLHGVQEPPDKSHKICIYVYFSGESPTISFRLSKRSVAPKELEITAPDAFSLKGFLLTLLCGLKRVFGVLGDRGVNTVKLRFLEPEKKFNLVTNTCRRYGLKI